MVKERPQAAQYVLWTSPIERAQVRGGQEAMPGDMRKEI
jgi:hypothetical protein